MSQMLKSSGGMAVATLASRVLGLVREMAYAWFMGADWVAGAFILAFMIPNLFRRLLGEGALTAAFIPIFKEKEKTAGEAEMWRSANAVMSGLMLILTGLVVLAVLLISGALALHEFTAKTDLMLRLMRVMFPYVLLVCVASLFMGMLNARGHFFIPALGSALLNIVLISSVFLLTPLMGTALDEKIFGLAIGVLIAGVAQAVFQWPLLRREGFRCHWVPPWSHPTVHRVIRQMIPGILGVAAYQINVLLSNGIAWLVDGEIVASFNYAVRLMELPQGVFGLSLATYLLPTLSGLAAEKKYPEFRKTLGQGMGYLLFINLLATLLLVILAEPIVRLLFERGKFDTYDTGRAASALICLAPGLLAFSTVNILARAFYALGDLKTPMRISVFCLALNVLLVAVLIGRFREAGMGIANSTTAFLNAALLLYALRRKLARLDLGALPRHLIRMLAASAAAAVTAYAAWNVWNVYLGHATLGLRLGEVFVPMTAATGVYLALGIWLQIPYARDLLKFLPKKP